MFNQKNTSKDKAIKDLLNYVNWQLYGNDKLNDFKYTWSNIFLVVFDFKNRLNN